MDTPPSPLSLPPCPLSPVSVSQCPLLDLSITAELCPQNTSRGTVPASQTHTQNQLIRGQRKGRLHGNSSASNHPPEHLVTSGQVAACPEGAELNTTLALRAELQSLQEVQWDATKALKQTLDKNERTQALISSRATQGVSFPRCARLYSALVSVHVPEGHVIRQAALQRLPLATNRKAPPAASTGPSLLPLTSDLCHRPLPLQPGPSSSVQPRSHSAPFSLFQRQQRWAAVP
ncbi:protein phosphatase 1 regulatory subunit 35 [Periophthalmus magnuspinnatus]|uniref:protein phosphatase 1 regulatory subunit 35 n=1 Tax=Periophthalmus magnuspinnatus TaxID=409849 RepID=UPI00243718E4|nr:protein phosphatase 1 regulatory subunit 35 [Periophthalmus magnuspinnatus]